MPKPVHGYSLSFGEGAINVELEAPDRASAFETAQRLVKEGRPATLLEGGVPLAQISYSSAGFWTLSEGTGAAA